MLAWVGCVADAPEVAANFGDDIAFRADSYDVDLGGMAALAFFLSHAGAGGSLGHRARSISCPAGHRREPGRPGHPGPLPGHLGPGRGPRPRHRHRDRASPVLRALGRSRGASRRLGGTDIALPVRIFHLADVVEVYDRRGGVRARCAKRGDVAADSSTPRSSTCSARLPTTSSATIPDVYDASGRIVAEPQLVVPLSNGELDHALTALPTSQTCVVLPAPDTHDASLSSRWPPPATTALAG